MPTLPTFTVSDAVANRLMAAFSDYTDDQGKQMPPQQAYKHWLRQSLISYVTAQEAQTSRSGLENDLA